jgi:hypothetical protein
MQDQEIDKTPIWQMKNGHDKQIVLFHYERYLMTIQVK